MGAEEQDAAEKAAAHANTPTIIHTDTLARGFYTLQNDGINPLIHSYEVLDITGSRLAVVDGRDLTPLSYHYNMLQAPCYQQSLDSGSDRTLIDVAGQPLYAWDALDNQTEMEYDVLRRPLKRITDSKTLERYIYGETRINPKELNYRGQLYQSYDGSGRQQVNGYDFKGNPLATQLQLIEDPSITDADWTILDDTDLSTEVFINTGTFDALNRPVTTTDPGGNIQSYTYDKGGALKTVELNAQVYVQDIHYDAKGQRQAIWYGNDTKTSYTYDEFTFRLRRLLTVNLNNNEILQDLNYWYDPVGNITELQDHAQQTLFFNNSVVSPTQAFIYDALYRLKEASGRELIGTATFGAEDNWNDAVWQTTHKGDSNAIQNYTQQYTYDAVGNILELRHIADAGAYTRTYNVATDSNRLLHTTVGRIAPDEDTYSYAYDVRGNMTEMPHLDAMHWNLNNELHKIENGTMEAFYQYSAGQRIRKYVDKGSIKEERIYLGSFEIYRKFNHTSSLVIERQTVHVNDDTGRIAMLETRTVGDAIDDHNTAEELIRYIYSNHLQSASLELDEIGAIISYEEYHPYGTTSYQAMNANIHAVAKRYRYTGKERDEESGLYYHGARYYIPWLCRWVSPEPLNSLWYNSQNINYENIESRKDLNNALQAKYPTLSSYNYCTNNPIKFIDPDGKRIVIKGSREYRREVKKALSMIKQTDIGRKVYNDLKNSKHTLTISDLTPEDKKKFKKQGRDTFEQQAHYNDGVNALPEDKNQLKMAGKLISNDPATFAHEFFHAYIDLIEYNDDDKLLKAAYDKEGQWRVQENPAMAFENYFRKIYGLGEREQYGYKGEEKAVIMAKLFSMFPGEVQDADSRIKVLNYGFDFYYDIGPGLDLQNRNLRASDTGIMQYQKTDKSGTKIISDDINKDFTQP